MSPFTPDITHPARTLATTAPGDPGRASAPNSPLQFKDPGDEQGRPNACLEDAMRFEAGASSHRFGMYGGMTPAERDIRELASAA